MSDAEYIFLLAAITVTAITWLIVDILLRRKEMSQTAALTAAVASLTSATQAVATAFANAGASSTPDAEITPVITAISAAATTLQNLVAPPAPAPAA